MASVTSICNRALQRLGTSNRILDITDDTRNGRACNVCYNPLRQKELRKHYWGFAKADQVLSPIDGTPVDPNFKYQFLLPPDCLRIIKPVDPLLDWQVSGRSILTSQSNVLYLKYIKDVTDPTLFDAIFSEMLSCSMADAMCEEITQSTSKKATIKDDYKDLQVEGKQTNAFETIPVGGETGTWILARL